MGLDQAMIVAGIGCRKGASANEIGAAITAALSRAGLRHDALGLIAAPALKSDEPGIAAAASDLGVPLVPQADLEAAGSRTATRSARVVALMGVPSAAEAAALAAGGPAARLLAPRIAVGPATCALATNEGAS
jgi:cobalt-precorrin 5A hydrolase